MTKGGKNSAFFLGSLNLNKWLRFIYRGSQDLTSRNGFCSFAGAWQTNEFFGLIIAMSRRF
jgi:hypothetical protein